VSPLMLCPCLPQRCLLAPLQVSGPYLPSLSVLHTDRGGATSSTSL
jgi:hypothetical protein